MGIFDGILGNIDDIAAKLGLPADQVQAMASTLGSKIEGGSDQLSALAETAQEHGLSMDKIQEMLGQLGDSGMLEKLGLGGEGSITDKVGDLLQGEEGEGALGKLAGLARGFLGKG